MLQQLISQRREAILEAWFDRIVDGYPDQTAHFLRGSGNRFANPVGSALRDGLGDILDAVARDEHHEDVRIAMDRIIRIRAVQDMPPSTAVGFVVDLKRVLREKLGDALPREARDRLDDRIDRLVLLGFDVYAVCRDDVCRIRIDAMRDRSLKVMERFNAWQDRRAERQTDRTVRPEEGGRS